MKLGSQKAGGGAFAIKTQDASSLKIEPPAGPEIALTLAGRLPM
jgi:hypothetical protein